MRQFYLKYMILILLSMWWGWTVLVDFFIVPAVFQIVDNFFQAGELGIAVFSNLNRLEIITASLLTGILSVSVIKNRGHLFLFLMSIILWAISMTYIAYLTPKLIELTALWKNADLTGQINIPGQPDIQQTHQFFHRCYIITDTFKLCLISIMLILVSTKKDNIP